MFIKDKFPRKLKRIQRVTSVMPFPTEDTVLDDLYNVWICGSLNKNQKKMNDLFNAIEPINVSRVAGSGNKIVYLVD